MERSTATIFHGVEFNLLKNIGHLAATTALDFGHTHQPILFDCGVRSNISAYEAAKLATDFDPQNRDENIDYYIAKLDELMKKFGGFTAAAASSAEQESLAL